MKTVKLLSVGCFAALALTACNNTPNQENPEKRNQPIVNTDSIILQKINDTAARPAPTTTTPVEDIDMDKPHTLNQK